MALCGIKKYDGLPARVGLFDVDYLRWRLYWCDHGSPLQNIPVLCWLVPPGRFDVEERRIIVGKLEGAKELWEERRV
jgi:hypothetical protein